MAAKRACVLYFLVLVSLKIGFKNGVYCKGMIKSAKDDFVHDINSLLYNIIREKRLDARCFAKKKKIFITLLLF